MSLNDWKEKWKRGPTDVTGIDFGRAAVKFARLRRNGDIISLAGTGIVSGIAFDGTTPSTDIPAKLQARHVSIAVSGGTANAKLLTFPGPVDASFEHGLPKSLGLNADTNDRMAYRIITEGIGRTESRVLAVSIPEAAAGAVMRRFETGLPAPCSLELSPVAALTAFEAGVVQPSSQPTIGLLDFGTTTSTLSIFHKKALILIRRFDFGIKKLLDRVTTALHIDLETALNILSDNAFDISELITEIMGPFSSQLIVSRDFAERRENCSLKNLHIIGGIASSQAATHELERSLHTSITVFDPFDIPSMQRESPDALPASDRWQYAAAVGAALGTLMEKP